MSTLTLTDEQVIELVKQLSPNKQAELCEFLLTARWGALENFTQNGEEHARMAAWKRGRDWDAMNEDERLEFVDDLVHEDRPCFQ